MLAIDGGKPVCSKPWPDWPVWDEREEKAVLEVIRSGKWWYGNKIREFEEKFAAFQDAKYGVCCTSGTTALEICLVSLGIGAGDEVIVPAYSFVATVSAVLNANAVPVFAEIDLQTGNLDPTEAERLIGERTKAIIPVHVLGLPCDMDRLKDISKKYDVRIIEDACHSWGSKWKGKGTGALGECGAFSFQASKNITSGEGGIILTDSRKIADKARSYTNSGRGLDDPWYEHYLLGGNHRLTEFQAALLLAQLSRLEEHVTKRQENAHYLNSRLNRIEGVETIKEDPRVTRRSYHGYLFRYIEEEWDSVSIQMFLSALRAEGIPCSTCWTQPLYRLPLFRRKGTGPAYCPISCPYFGKEVDYTQTCCPNTEKLCKEGVLIPHPVLLAEREDMDMITEAIEKIRNGLEELSKMERHSQD